MLIAKDMWRRGLWDGDHWKRGSARTFANANVDGRDLAYCGAILAHREAWATDILKGVRQLRAAYDQVRSTPARVRG